MNIWCPKPFPALHDGRALLLERVPLRPRAGSPLVPVWSNHVPHPNQTSPGTRPVASERPRAPRWLVAVDGRSGWLCGRRPRAMCTTFYCRLCLPSRPLPSHPMRSWNHVRRDVPITGRGAAAINVLSRQARRGGRGAQDRHSGQGSPADLPRGSQVGLPRGRTAHGILFGLLGDR